MHHELLLWYAGLPSLLVQYREILPFNSAFKMMNLPIRDQKNAMMEAYEMTDMDCDGSPTSSNAQSVGSSDFNKDTRAAREICTPIDQLYATVLRGSRESLKAYNSWLLKYHLSILRRIQS